MTGMNAMSITKNRRRKVREESWLRPLPPCPFSVALSWASLNTLEPAKLSSLRTSALSA
jgi:hypothetical protein